MGQRRRWKLSAEQRSDLWKRWKTGESLHAIGRALGKEHHVIHFLLARHGGIAPPVRRRCLRALTLAEREDISRGIASGESIRGIAKGLQRAESTVSREVARHGGRPLYRANEADQQAWIREGQGLGPARVFAAEPPADLHLRERVGKLVHRIREVVRIVSRSHDQAIEPQH